MSDAVTSELKDTTEYDVWWYLKNYNKPQWVNSHEVAWRYRMYGKKYNLPKPIKGEK